jgi:hypothetical protein
MSFPMEFVAGLTQGMAQTDPNFRAQMESVENDKRTTKTAEFRKAIQSTTPGQITQWASTNPEAASIASQVFGSAGAGGSQGGGSGGGGAGR